MRVKAESIIKFGTVGFTLLSIVVTLVGLTDINEGLSYGNPAAVDAGWNLFYWGIFLLFVSLITIMYLVLKKNRLIIVGLFLGSILLLVALLPPIFLAKPLISAKDFAVDAEVFPQGAPIPNNATCPLFNQTDFDFEVQLNAIFIKLNFSRVQSSAHIVVALPFKIVDAFAWPGGPTTLPLGFQPEYPKATEIQFYGQHAWIQNISFANPNRYSTKLLNGTVATQIKLGSDIREIGPWQDSLFLSFGSITSPLRFISSKVCMALFPASPLSVVITFPQNQIVAAGTFPTPNFTTTNLYTRGVWWYFPSSNHFNDVQLFLESITPSFNSEVPWTTMIPFPAFWQPFALSVAFVILQVSLTRFFSQRRERQESPRIPKAGLRYIS